MKIIYKCAVDGVAKMAGEMVGLCPHSKCGDETKCAAHGNKKCKYKSKVKS